MGKGLETVPTRIFVLALCRRPLWAGLTLLASSFEGFPKYSHFHFLVLLSHHLTICNSSTSSLLFIAATDQNFLSYSSFRKNWTFTTKGRIPNSPRDIWRRRALIVSFLGYFGIVQPIECCACTLRRALGRPTWKPWRRLGCKSGENSI